MKNQTIKKELPAQIERVISIVEKLFQEQILGIYLYGSATIGNLQPDSDIDILVITNCEMTISVRENLTQQLLAVSGQVGCVEKRALEVTVINRNDIIPFQFPPKCEYMYGEWLREEMEAGNSPQSCYDPDITILLWQAKQYSITLRGIDSKELIPNISFHEIEKAIESSLPSLISSSKGDERNVLLTLSRMWFTLETKKVATKDIAAEWVLPQLPTDFLPLLKMAKEAYLGNVHDDWKGIENKTAALIKFMEQQLEKKLQTN